MRARPRPEIVVSLRSYSGATFQDTVQAKDVLWVLGEEKQGFVKCIQAINGVVKRLPANIDLLCSTDPEQLFLPLSEIISHLSLPAKVLMKPPMQLPELASQIPMLQNVQTGDLMKFTEESLLVCQRTIDVDASEAIFSMPQNVDLEMTVVSQAPEERKILCQKVARMLSSSYTDRAIDESFHALVVSERNKSSFDIQLAFLQGYESNHITICPMCPADVEVYLSSAKSKTPASSFELETRLQYLEKDYRYLSTEVEDCKKSVSAINNTIRTELLPETQKFKKTSLQLLKGFKGV